MLISFRQVLNSRSGSSLNPRQTCTLRATALNNHLSEAME
jgi:hypothetical protein